MRETLILRGFSYIANQFVCRLIAANKGAVSHN